MTPPSPLTLKKYGLTEQDWIKMYNDQDGRCFICQCRKDQLCIDHKHVPGWKRMPPEQRKLYVRKLLCRHCNGKLLPHSMTVDKAKRIVLLLKEFEEKLRIIK